MEQTFAYSSWIFTRALSVIYLIAFLSLLVQARGLWGSQGVLPIRPFMKSVEETFGASRVLHVPSLFWLSTSDDFIVGAAITGAVFAGAALFGFAQGWSLLMCFAIYLSFCNSGQEFMSFQWDSLLVEVGFLALFTVPWNFDFALNVAGEPHWLVRGMFYVVLFKLMFLSGVVKLMSGDEAWRDFSAMNYHYWTQPLPNPLSAFAHALPEWIHQSSVGLTFAIELILPFFMLWPRARVWVASGFFALSMMILLTGNYTFFNWLTLALCIWLVPDSVWYGVVERLPFTLTASPAAMFPHPVVSGVMGVLALLSLVWCVRFWIPDPVLELLEAPLHYAQLFRVSHPYGLFAVMTKSRPEIILEGSNDGVTWKEYEFKFKGGPLYRRPPFVAPHQPRLDWQMWFAALGTPRGNPWVRTLMQRIIDRSPDVLEFFSLDPFADSAGGGTGPKMMRARVYNYEFTSPEEILESDKWWTRTFVGDYR